MSVLSPDPVTPLSYFATLVSDDRNFPLLEAAASVAQDTEPGLDLGPLWARLDGWGQTLAARVYPGAPPAHRLHMLNHFFFQDLGFGGPLNDPWAIEHGLVHRVVEQRRGWAITLALVFMELAQALHLPVKGVPFPGHFLVQCSVGQGEVFLDLEDGTSLSRRQLEDRLQPHLQAQGWQHDWSLPLSHFLQAASPRQVLAWLLRQMKNVHREQSQWASWLAVQERLVLLLPDEWGERRDRGFAHAELGQWDRAQADWSHYLQAMPDATDAPSVQAAMAAVQGRTQP